MKAGVRAWDSGVALHRPGEEEMAGSEGCWVDRGGPPAPVVEVDSHGSMPWYKSTLNSKAAQEEPERGLLPEIPGTTQLGVGRAPHFGGARGARAGPGHG